MVGFPFRCSLLALLLAGFASGAPAAEPDAQGQQARIGAAYLYHFLQLVRWPGEEGAVPEGPFAVCLFGKDPFGEVIDAISRRKARGREIAVRRLADLHQVERCHLLFVGAGQAAQMPDVLRAVEAAGVLTVSDGKDFVARGGMIGFVTVPDESEGGFRVRFEINLEAARKRGLKINSKLLELATQVRQ